MSDYLTENIVRNTRSKLEAYNRSKSTSTTRRKTRHTVQTVSKRSTTQRVTRLQSTDALHPIESQARHDASLDNPRWTNYLAYKAQAHLDNDTGAIARLYVSAWNSTINRR